MPGIFMKSFVSGD